MGWLDSILGGGGEQKATDVYTHIIARFRLPIHEEYFAVVGAIEFLSIDDPKAAMESLYRQINEYTDRTGIHVGGLEVGNFELPFKTLLDALQTSIRARSITKQNALNSLRKKRDELSKRL
ncbi:MAG: hypothetical protein ACHRXM_00775 [Isosphaerales bacterium]